MQNSLHLSGAVHAFSAVHHSRRDHHFPTFHCISVKAPPMIPSATEIRRWFPAGNRPSSSIFLWGRRGERRESYAPSGRRSPEVPIGAADGVDTLRISWHVWPPLSLVSELFGSRSTSLLPYSPVGNAPLLAPLPLLALLNHDSPVTPFCAFPVRFRLLLVGLNSHLCGRVIAWRALLTD